MTIDNILISRFFKNLCTEEEALAVAKYLEAHPEKLDELLPHGLWDHMEELSFPSASKKEELLQAITAQAGIKERRPVLIWSLSIAASLLMVLGLGWWMGIGTYKTPDHEKETAATTYTLVKINFGKEEMKLDIADGSVIYLKPGGEIRYLEQLSKQNRDFKLKGAARFKVAEDKTRPFNVYAGGTVTTALGTDFTISSEEDDDNVSVLLHSGKVVVSADSSVHANGMKKTYLLPGNKLLINKTNFSLALIKNGDQPVLKSEVIEQNGQTELTATEISFRNQSLDKIFNVLESNFSADIQFEKVRFKGMYFTGSFKRNDETVENVINEIALLNHLNVERRDSTYILKPQSKKQSTN
ncbi:FecR family protein [Pedobacter nyackensis]|uniref:FecR family protein n=1 Tax=Pedobacter nyackensis TaxID=475255 RepID=A0A1W2AAF8_9SPHI|nr:FecR family protein [Pedobacter nyackensis]SMC57719.1 FecR family protein [Pedobacter nyackensis]